ncbi:MAG TPA: MetQ/NlpA family ABC transporter substrate-binding protein [Anaerolineae bacterium]|nr:MetQ/NlpA family ABC transporter substrate-binding protein [Anaerolineae bacterium]
MTKLVYPKSKIQNPKLKLVFILILLLLVGCRRAAPAAPLRIAVLPILDTLPLYVAETEGYFTQHGVTVELVPAASAAERDQLLQAGQVDGVITDLVALALYNRESPEVVAVRYAMVATPDFAQFRILAAAQSGFTRPADLRDISIGVSEGTVIEYVTTRLLQAEGLADDEIATLAVPKIADRMALLNAGELQAATLPEPLASLAIQQGAVVIMDDARHPEFSCSLFAFRQASVKAQPEAIRNFLTAIEQASAAINADKGRWSNLLTEKQLVPPALEAYPLPDYPAAAVPTEAQFDDVLAWLEATERLAETPSYSDVVNAAFLEK